MMVDSFLADPVFCLETPYRQTDRQTDTQSTLRNDFFFLTSVAPTAH